MCTVSAFVKKTGKKRVAKNSSFGFLGLAFLRVGKNQMCYFRVGFSFSFLFQFYSSVSSSCIGYNGCGYEQVGFTGTYFQFTIIVIEYDHL
jgi:hypothetical protein